MHLGCSIGLAVGGVRRVVVPGHDRSCCLNPLPFRGVVSVSGSGWVWGRIPAESPSARRPSACRAAGLFPLDLPSGGQDGHARSPE
jgi:hypothetical protein